MLKINNPGLAIVLLALLSGAQAEEKVLVRQRIDHVVDA